MERLLQGVIDYAGQFPPARLSMADAVSQYLQTVSGPDEWIVSRFVCSTNRLSELADTLRNADYVPVSAVGRPSRDRGSWEEALAQDAADMNDFHKRMGDRAEVEAYEIKIPDHAGLPGYSRDLGGFRDADVFLELPWGEGLDDSLAFIAETEWLGAKGRTGGLEASAFPDAWNLAGFIRGCVDLDVPFKLTAGLHHPLPCPDPATGATMHGFLNVLGAAAFSISEDMSRRDMERLLLDADPTAWKFEARQLVWRDRVANLDDLDEARARFVSFGSCSVDEPLDGLRELGLLAA